MGRQEDRRVVHHDRRGRPSAIVVWHPDGALVTAAVRIPDRSWVSIEPRAGEVAPWGAVDRLWHGADADARTTSVTVFGTVDWARITTIPPLAEPARLPPGAGTAVLNLLATLAREQGIPCLRYAGPYPTEALFLALLECFRPERADRDLLRHFMSDDLAWIPAPFTPAFEETAYVQWRDERVEKVVWEGRTYYREESGPVRRRAPFRVHDDGDRVACSLWALGAPLAHHLVLEADATTRVVAPSGAAAGPGRVLPPAVREGLVALVIALSAPPLASALREVTAGVVFTRGPLARDLVRVTDDEVRVSSTFADALSRRLAEPAAADARAYQALGALTELAVAMADPLRLRAQARLAAAAADGLVTALEHVDDDPDSARTITAAVERLLASGGVDDQPDVEGDEPDDGKH
jgi:hypothetical protein